MSITGNYDDFIKDFMKDFEPYQPATKIPDVGPGVTETPYNPADDYQKLQEQLDALRAEMSLKSEQQQTAASGFSLAQNLASTLAQTAAQKQMNEIARMNMLARLQQSRQEMRSRMDQSALGNFAINLLGYR